MFTVSNADYWVLIVMNSFTHMMHSTSKFFICWNTSGKLLKSSAPPTFKCKNLWRPMDWYWLHVTHTDPQWCLNTYPPATHTLIEKYSQNNQSKSTNNSTKKDRVADITFLLQVSFLKTGDTHFPFPAPSLNAATQSQKQRLKSQCLHFRQNHIGTVSSPETAPALQVYS